MNATKREDLHRANIIPAHGNNLSILIADCHQEYPIPHANLHMHEVFNAFHVHESMEILFPTNDEREEKMALIQKELITRRLFDVEKLEASAHFDVDYWDSLYVLTGQDKHHIANAKDWAIEIMRALESVSGDDTYFDYFPNWVDAFEEYALALGQLDLIKDVRDACREGVYGPDEPAYEDTIPVFDITIYAKA